MRYPAGHAAATRKRIVHRASRLFRAHGFAATGVDAAMKAAGLTPGGFYAHFRSKEELLELALEAGLAENCARMSKVEGNRVAAYLSEKHRDMRAAGCTVAGLAPEVSRAPLHVRAAFSSLLDRYLRTSPLTAGLPRPDALALFATLVGSLVLARAVPNPETSRAVLAAGRSAARRLKGGRR